MTGPKTRALYEADEHEWIARQIEALRDGRFQSLDRDNLIEYLTEMTNRDRRELRQRFSVLIHHLLKVRMQPEKWSRSWVLTILEQQDEIAGILHDTPSIQQHSERLFVEAYPMAVRKAASETGIPSSQFPDASPWTIEQALTFNPPPPPQPI